MRATGLFFLTGRPQLVVTRNDAGTTRREWRLPLIERLGDGKGTQLLSGMWPGVEAAVFVRENARTLVAGCALNIEFGRIRPDGDRLLGRIVACELAPQRWPAAAMTPATTSESTTS